MRLIKSSLILILSVALNLGIYAAVPYSLGSLTVKSERPADSRLTLKEQIMIAKMKQFIAMTPAEYGASRGKELNFLERISFRLSQRRMKHLLKSYDYGDGPDTLQKISWLLKGLLLGPIALILGYIFLKDDDRELIKWIWFGFIGFTAIVVLILLSM